MEHRPSPFIDGDERDAFGIYAMLRWALIFLVIAIIAGLLGFTDVQAASATIAALLRSMVVSIDLVANAICD